MVYHVRYPIRKANEKYLNNYARRMNMIILLLLGIIYYYINVLKYKLILLGLPIELFMLFLPLVSLIYFLPRKILYDTEKTSEETSIVWGEHKGYKWLYRIILLITGIPMLYIMLKNKLTVFPNETILQIGDYLTITESYTIVEKMKYLSNYLKL